MFYGGEVVGESAIKHFDEIGMEVTHKYVVVNEGPWRVDELQVEVLWPYQVENGREKGKWLLYMTEHPTVDGKLTSQSLSDVNSHVFESSCRVQLLSILH